MLLNEDRLLDLEIENLKALLARAAAAVPQAAAGNLPHGKRRPPVPPPAWGGHCRMRGLPRKAAGPQHVLLSSGFESCGSRRDVQGQVEASCPYRRSGVLQR